MLVLGVSLCFVMSASDNAASCDNHSDTPIVVSVSPTAVDTESEGGQSSEYTVSLLCPSCKQIMYAKFKKGYTASTTARCEKCYTRYVIKYSWQSDHKEPTIREMSVSR